jgi:hypothetical protein
MPGQRKKPDEGQQRGKASGQVGAQDQQTHQKSATSAAVGIIFLHRDNLWIDSTPLNDAADYGALKTHEKGHPEYWEELQRRGLVPIDVEYDEVPRGRVTADPKRGTSLLLLDRCIRDRPEMIARIFSELHLPPAPATAIGADSHYICPECRPKQLPRDDDEGW